MIILLRDKISYSGDNVWITPSICFSSLTCHQIVQGETKNISKNMCCFYGFFYNENTDHPFSFHAISTLLLYLFCSLCLTICVFISAFEEYCSKSDTYKVDVSKRLIDNRLPLVYFVIKTSMLHFAVRYLINE